MDKLSSKVQQQGEAMLVAARDSSALQQSLRDKDAQIDKLEKEIEAAKRREVDLQLEVSRNISYWTERQAEKDASAGKELAALRSQVTELLSAVTAATGKITAMEKEQGQWKTKLEADNKEQKKLLEEKVEKLDKVVQSKVVSLSVTEVLRTMSMMLGRSLLLQWLYISGAVTDTRARVTGFESSAREGPRP